MLHQSNIDAEVVEPALVVAIFLHNRLAILALKSFYWQIGGEARCHDLIRWSFTRPSAWKPAPASERREATKIISSTSISRVEEPVWASHDLQIVVPVDASLFIYTACKSKANRIHCELVFMLAGLRLKCGCLARSVVLAN